MPLSIHLIMATDVKKNNNILKLDVYDSNVSGYRKSSLASKLAYQSMIMQRIALLTCHK